MESALANNIIQVVKNFSKLVIGNVQLKIMIVGNKDFLEPLGKIAKDTINENLYSSVFLTQKIGMKRQ
jgi:hypothetical protein